MPAPSPIATAPAYHRHRPEQTTLYAIVAKHYPRFVQEIGRAGGHLPRFVRQEFDDYLKCGRLEHGFLRVKCDGCMHEHLVAFSRPLLRIPAPATFVIPFTSQTVRILPQLRRPAHGRVGRPPGRSRVSRGGGEAAQAKLAWRFARNARSLAGVPISACGGKLRVIACIEDPPLIARILGHVRQRAVLGGSTPCAPPDLLPELKLT